MGIVYGIGIFLLGIGQGFLNTIAGGGSFVVLPALTFMGLDLAVANATNRVGVIIQAISGAATFHRHKVLDFRAALPLAGVSMLGSILGTLMAVQIDKRMLNIVVAVLISIMAFLLVFRPKMWEGGERKPRPKWVVFAIFFAIGIYGGFLQAGVGFFLTWAVAVVLGQDLVRGNALRTLIVAAFTTVSLAIFISKGLVVFSVGLVLAAGNMIGGVLGARFTVLKGSAWVRRILAVVIVVSAIKMVASAF